MLTRLMKKKKKEEEERNLGIDRLSSLPEELLIHILSFLDSKHAVQASLSLKKWVNLWTLIPNIYITRRGFKDHSSFEKFLSKVLSLYDGSVMIDKSCYRSKPSKSTPDFLKFVVSHEFQHVTFEYVSTEGDDIVDRFGSCDSVRSLKLISSHFHRSICLKQVVTMHLRKSAFFEPELFSGCPNLKNLTFCLCWFKSNYSSDVSPVHIVAPQLSRLTMLYCFGGCDPRLMISTPRLTSFKIADRNVPLLKTDDLAFLDTVDVDVDIGIDFLPSSEERNRQLFSKLDSFLKCFGCAKSVRISSDMVKILSKLPDELAREPSPFCNLRSVNIVSSHSKTIPGHVMTYLIGKSPHAKTVFEEHKARAILMDA